MELDFVSSLRSCPVIQTSRLHASMWRIGYSFLSCPSCIPAVLHFVFFDEMLLMRRGVVCKDGFDCFGLKLSA